MLYHFSENPNITTFVPRPSRDELPHAVWAIDEEHAVNYCLPRDCPRVVYSRSQQVSEQDLERFFAHTVSHTIMVVESGWLDRIRRTTLYKYIFLEEGFVLQDPTAGYYIATRTVTPVGMEKMEDLLGSILQKGVELRFTPNLHPVRNAILGSTIDRFSIIRFRNAVGAE